MIKLNPSLRGALVLTFASVALILVLGYSFLVTRYYMSGMDTIIADNLARAATAIADGEGLSGSNTFDAYTVTRRWQDQPASIVAAAPTPPPTGNRLQKATLQGVEGQPDQLFFYMTADTPEGPFYVSFYILPDKVSDMVARNVRDSLVTLLTIGLGSALAVALVVWGLMRRVAQPVTRLGMWARELNEQSLDDEIPDFGFRDLNDFAEVVRNSLLSVKDGLDREQTFLRQASHELRTPISVIRNNIQLLEKLKSRQSAAQQDPRETAVVKRIDRASLTMKHLTETLLWMGRDAGGPLQQNEVQLDQLVQNSIHDLKYLLDGKNVQLSIWTHPCTCELPETAARIVVGNLIRNAFQHTWEGQVHITQKGRQVEIANYQILATETAEDLGFGLGLQLTEKLTRRLGWTFDNTVRRDGRSTRVYLESGPPDFQGA